MNEPPRKGPKRGGPGGGGGGRAGWPIGIRQLRNGDFELTYPRSTHELMDDYQEAMELWKEGEVESARDALRYALEGSSALLWAHAALGRMALEVNRDLPLARGHFGFVIEMVERAIPKGFLGRLPAKLQANAPLYDAIEGLALCYEGMGKRPRALELRAWGKRLSQDVK